VRGNSLPMLPFYKRVKTHDSSYERGKVGGIGVSAISEEERQGFNMTLEKKE